MYKIIRKLSEQKFYIVSFWEPGRCNSIDRSLRRTLGLQQESRQVRRPKVRKKITDRLAFRLPDFPDFRTCSFLIQTYKSATQQKFNKELMPGSQWF